MQYTKTMRLRDGTALEVRSLRVSDAEEMLRHRRQTVGETLNMMRYPDEIATTVLQEAENIRGMECAPRSLMLGAFLDGRIVGAANFRPVHPADRVSHRAAMGVSVLKAYWNRGIATALMTALTDAAGRTTLEQLELDVVSTNAHAIALYKRFGFHEIGRHPRAFKYRDGTYADLILMMRSLKE